MEEKLETALALVFKLKEILKKDDDASLAVLLGQEAIEEFQDDYSWAWPD